ncbi:transposase [Candidatus Reidiella endopervernicosa]|uniref:Transposase n=1 Tax=Candidatus Reidiella endopervernicosa TaxID=2738883 RepID=A0A6N0HUU6_9GAMM|nr:transposase [Candidatus Reidiella endopervernicosa]QKQ25966.1 transposase [Candidatus Reidiella endopervernicosa]
MTRKRKPYKTYTKEFKLEAVRLMDESDRPATDIAMELGIRRNQLYKWKEQLSNKGNKAFEGPGRPKKQDQSEVTTLRQENERLKEELEILKKAAAYFARDLSEVRLYSIAQHKASNYTALSCA